MKGLQFFPADQVEICEETPKVGHDCKCVSETTETFCNVTYTVVSRGIQQKSREAGHVCTKLRKQNYDLMLLFSHTDHQQRCWNYQILQMKYGKLRSEFTLIIKLGKQILMMPSAKRPVLWSSRCAHHLFRCSRCTLRFVFSVCIFPSITAHFTLQWDLLSYCITGAWRLKNYDLRSHYETISTRWDKFFSGRAIISCGFSVAFKP